ncbi:MAG TPA: hypothetical protein IAA12_05990 [Candidatus Blautia intestinipullorum]|nr:hypothetical protein [Candidatus Blautia intestinipullorum]
MTTKTGKMKKRRKAFVEEESCVACGCCRKVCSRECPASVIEIREVQA